MVQRVPVAGTLSNFCKPKIYGILFIGTQLGHPTVSERHGNRVYQSLPQTKFMHYTIVERPHGGL